MKKLLAVVSYICLIFSLLSFNTIMVSAETEGSYTYSISNGEATIVKYKGNNTTSDELIIPSTLGGYPVTEIGQSAFKGGSLSSSVLVVPGSIKKIGAHAFENSCVETLILNEGVIEIDDCAFKYSSLTTIKIPKSLSIINWQAFQFCRIDKVYIADIKAWCEITRDGSYNGNNPLSYGKSAQLYLNNILITELKIPEGVTSIRTDAFNGCKDIKSVVLPSSVTYISNNAFRECTGISDVWYTGGENERGNIKIGDENTYLTNATWHYDSCPVGAPHSYSNDCDETCNGCGKKRTVSGHSYDNACDTTCNICKEARTVPHSYDNSCDTQCNICNSSRTILHKYGEWDVTKQASCTESGTKVRKCSVCSKTETNTISSLGHNFSTEWTTDKKATCTTAGSKSNHCTRCSATSNHTTILASGHNWSKWVTEKKATEKAEGLSVRKCNECGLKETQTIAKLAADGHTHKFGEWQITKAATCIEKGLATRACTICKEKEKKELLATGHQVGEWVETSATCTIDGNRERVCVICNEIEKITIKALGHDFENPVVIKEPTDNEKGIKQGKCKRCGEETTEEIPALLSDNNNVSNTSSDIETSGENEDNNKNTKHTNKYWLIWTVIGIVAFTAIGFGIYLILKKTHFRN